MKIRTASILRSLAGTALFAMAGVGSAWASPITQPTQLVAPQFSVNFNSLTVGLKTGPLVFSGVTVTGSNLSVIDTDSFAASVNFPSYVSDKALGIPQLPGPGITPFTLTFASAVWQVGFGMFDTNFPGTQIRAFDSLGNLLETTAPDALFPTGGAGADYVGFVRTSADIASIQIIPGTASGVDALWIDNLAFSSAAVPEPELPAMLGLGLIVLGGLRRRSRR